MREGSCTVTSARIGHESHDNSTTVSEAAIYDRPLSDADAAGRLTILMVDDNPAMVRGLSTLFAGAGYRVATAISGTEGLRKAEEIVPDLILLDVVMPDINGLEVCRRIRSNPALQRVVVVHLSASRSAASDQVDGLESGADAYLTLPIDNQELLARVNALMRMRRAEAALHESDQRYRALVEALPQMIWTCDADGECDHFSTQWCAYTGMTEAEARRAGWLAIVDSDDRARTEREWRSALTGGVAFEVKHRLRDRNGERQWFKTRSVPLRNDQGEIVQWVGTATDITDIIEVGESLRKSKEELEVAIGELAERNKMANLRSEIALSLARSGETQAILQTVVSAFTSYLDIALAQVWSVDPEMARLELLASDGIHTLEDAEHRSMQVDRSVIGRIVSAGEPELTNDLTNDPDVGDPEWVRRHGVTSFAGFPLSVEDRRLGVLALIGRTPLDSGLVTELGLLADRIGQFIERKRVERERVELMRRADEARREVELLNEIGNKMAAELDLQRLTQDVTDAATSLTKAEFGAFFYNVLDEQGDYYSLYTISGVPREAFSKFPMPRRTAIFDPTFTGQGVVRSDDIMADPRYGKSAPHYGMPAGHLPVRSYLAVPVVSRSGVVLGGLFFGHSAVGVFGEREEKIVKGMAAQAATAMDNAQLVEQLEKKVIERTRRLEETISELQAFSYTVSHDLRAPLRAMQNYAQILQEEYTDRLDETARHYLQRIQGSGARLDTLIQDLLTYSRISRAQIALQPVSLQKIVEDVIHQYPMLQAPGARITVAPDLPEVLGDESSITQIISNVLGNAVKFVADGRQPVITVDWEESERYRRLRIADNGIGIAPDNRDRIFRMFERAHNAQGYEGTGIGLAIVRKAMDRIGGKVGVESQLDHGSRFILDFRKP